MSSAHVFDVDGVLRPIDNRLKQLRCPPELLLGLFALGDITIVGHDSGDGWIVQEVLSDGLKIPA
jgi:hypothetical protein